MLGKVVFAALAALAALCGPALSDMHGLILHDMAGNPVQLDSLLAEGPVVIDFWATWCRPCRAEMPKLQAVMEDLAGQRVHFAAVSLDAPRNQARVEAYIEENKVTLPVYRDSEGSLAKTFQVLAIPTTFLLDQDAEITYKTRGYRPGDEILLKKAIQALLEKSGPPTKGQPASQ